MIPNDLKRNSVSPLVTGGTSASALFPTLQAHDPFATLVNAAVERSNTLSGGPQSSAQIRTKDGKASNAEGFEKFMSENITNVSGSQSTGTNKQTARTVYIPLQDSLANDLSKSKSEHDKQRMKLPVGELSETDMKLFPPAFHHLIQQQIQITNENEKLYQLEQRKKLEALTCAANVNERFRSVEALANSSSSSSNLNSSHSPSLKFAREPFSSEHFERELRHAEPDSQQQQQQRSKQPEHMDEASKLFSQSFQKDQIQERHSNSGGMTAANLIDAIITRQINTDSNSNKGSSTSITSNSNVSSVGPNSLSNFSISRFRSGMESGGNSGQVPPRPASTASMVSGPTPPLHMMKPESLSASSTPHPPNHLDCYEFEPKAHDFSKGNQSSNTGHGNGPAGSLRETIFNVITNNFVSTTPSPPLPMSVSAPVSSVVTSATTTATANDLTKVKHSIIEGIASTAVPPTQSSGSNSAVDKLRKALQTGEKHSLEDDSGGGSPHKRQTVESEVQLRQQVIHHTTTAPGSKTASMNMVEPISPPQSTNSSSSASTTAAVTVTASTHWPPTIAPTSVASSSAGQWTSMPTFSIFDANLRANLANLAAESSTATQQPTSQLPQSTTNSTIKTTSSVSSATTGIINDFFQNRFVEAMRGGNPLPTENEKRSETPKTNEHLKQPKTSEHSNKIMSSYPNSPSSPGEMVIDENRVSPVSTPSLNEHSKEKLKLNESPSSTPSDSNISGVIRKHSNNSGMSNFKFFPLIILFNRFSFLSINR